MSYTRTLSGYTRSPPISSLNVIDQAVIDNLQSATLTNAAGSASIALTQVGIYGKGLKEGAASRAVYLVGDRTLTVNLNEIKPLYPATVSVEVGATFAFTDGTVWTVLDAADSQIAAFQVLHARNLAIAAGLKDVVKLQHPTVTSDAAAGRSEAWSDVRTGIACRVQPDVTEDLDERGMRAAQTRYLVYLDPATGAGSTFAAVSSAGNMGRLVVTTGSPASANLRITAYRSAERIGELPYCECVKVP